MAMLTRAFGSLFLVSCLLGCGAMAPGRAMEASASKAPDAAPMGAAPTSDASVAMAGPSEESAPAPPPATPAPASGTPGGDASSAPEPGATGTLAQRDAPSMAQMKKMVDIEAR